MSVRISVDLSGFEAVWKEKTEGVRTAIQRALEEAGYAVKREMEGLSPVRTGALKGSITVILGEGNAWIGPTVPYAGFVEFGTRPSPGRYVPAIGKRLVNPALPHFGMHPGIRATHFVERTALAAEPQVAEVFNRILGEVLE